MRGSGWMRWVVSALVAVSVLASSAVAMAAEQRFALLLDTDNNPATGCSVATANGAVPGIDLVATAVVSTSANTVAVARLERQSCAAGVLGTPSVFDAGGWNVGLGNGVGGTAAIEASIPLSYLPPAATLKAVVAATNATGGQDATPAFFIALAAPAAAGPIAVPLSPWLALPLSLLLLVGAMLWSRRHPEHSLALMLLLVVSGSGLVWAATVIRDGNVGDWNGIVAAVIDATGDAPVNADVAAVYHQQDAANLYWRIDADVRKDAPGNQAPVVNAGPNQTITLPAGANLAGSASDDGQPNPPGALTTTWSLVSGPAAVVFGNANALATTATFSVAGTYVLRLTAFDGALSSASTLQISVNDVNAVGPKLVPIPDRTVTLGTRFQQLIEATSANVNETLTYALPTAPTGAALQPAPLVDWVPTLAQVGTQNFTAKVTDSQGRTATTSFKVTVVQVNHPPQLAPQADASVKVGATFARTLTATDQDTGDTLTFALVNGPAGMVLNGANLSWPTAGKTVGDYAATVKVTDAGGLSDTRSFTLKLLPEVAPVARDDAYEVRLGQTLSVGAATGVLANDLPPDATPLAATRLTNPDKGALDSFNADGSFNFTAPAVLPGPSFAPVVKYSLSPFPYGWAHQPLVIDVDGDGVPEIITNSLVPALAGLSAYHVKNGALELLWDLPDVSTFAPTSDCTTYHAGGEPMRLAAGDIDDSGKISLVIPVACQRDILTVPNGWTTARYMAINARDGTFKWLSPSLGGARPEPTWGGTSEDNIAWRTVPAIARLRAGESPSIVFAQEYANDQWGAQTRCERITPGFTGMYCRAAFVLDGRDGTVRQKMTALATDAGTPPTQGTSGTEQAVVVADLEGNGNMNIVFGATVWNADGSIKWNISDAQFTDPSSHIYTFWNGLGNFDDSPDIEIVRLDRKASDAGGGPARLAVFKADGRLLWSTPLSGDPVTGIPTIADVDGSGRPSVVVLDRQRVCAIDYRGLYKWCHEAGVSALAPTPNLRAATRVAVYDLDGDGVPEVIVPLYGERLRFLDGATGKVKFDYDMAAGRPPLDPGPNYRDPAIAGSPIVADFENSGHASILTVWSPTPRMDIVASQNNDWRPARKIFNQTSYHVGNVNDNGSIPATFNNNFANPATNVFGTQAQVLAPVDPRIRTQTKFTYSASAGGIVSNPATVTIGILPLNRPPAFTSTPPRTYVPFAYTAGSPFVYQAHAVDPDAGDTLTYSIQLASGPDVGTCTIGAASGKLQCTTINGGNGNPALAVPESLVIAATDSFGESAYQTFTLYPSAGPANVPDVVGMAKTTADTTLVAAGFATGTVSAIFNAAPVDQVLAQYPAAGASSFKGEAIALQISKGREPQPLPNLAGLSLTQARGVLVGLGFTVIVNPVTSPTAPANEVIGQAPSFGTTLQPPAAVTLDVSTGPPLVGTVAQVIVEPAPSARRVAGEQLAYRATAVFTDGTSTDVTIRSLWTSSAPAVASVDGTGSAKALTPGATTISAEAGGVTGQATLDVVARTPGDAINPVAQITAPADGATVTGPTPVTGTASDANFLRYELAVALAGDMNWTVIGEGTAPVTAGTLGTFDPTTLVNDLYSVRLTVFDRAGNQTVATSTLQVNGERKLGLFTLTYLDLNLPAVGIPVTVARTYDSRDKAKGDFGIGWRLGLSTLRLRANRIPGTGWVRNQSGPTVSLVPTSEHKVSLTLPGGRVEEFDLALSPTSGFGALDFTRVTGFTPRPGTVGKLELLANPNLLILNNGAEDELVDDETLDTFNPLNYRYTTLDGTRIEISRTEGVKKLTDVNGNTVTFGLGGIIHSSGRSINFVRDGQGRITQITDPSGNVQTYTYDSNGDLVTHTGAAGEVSRYAYDRRHGLIDALDPAGNHAARNDYDAAGLLISTTDALGHRVTFSHGAGTQREIVVDRLGNQTVFEYDVAGNIATKTDPLGNRATFTYDNRNNQLTESDALGRVATKTYDNSNNVLTSTDFEGNTTVNTYNARAQLLTSTDPEGHVTVNVYDANGNLAQVTDPEGGVTLHTYDAAGKRLTTTNPLGEISSFAYDSAGNRTTVTDPLGRTTTFAFDANGWILTQTDPVGKTIHRKYDAAGRLVAITDRLGNVSTLAYSNLGDGMKITSRTDALGRTTRIEYDQLGNPIKTTYPDSTVETSTFDAEGRLVSRIDREGHTTTFQFDALGRQTRVTYPDGAAVTTTFDAAGRVLTRIDERGNVTRTSYAPNQRTITDATGNTTLYLLDSQGRDVRTTDSLGRVTHFTYDSGGNLRRTTFPDTTFKAVTYDAARQRIAEVDQAGRTTHFGYDAAGQLVQVTGADGGSTTYTYDSLGNRLTQSDANGHVTRMTYDAEARVLTRTRPSGVSESFVYDAVANVVSHTDYNGRATVFTLDSLNRLARKALPGGVVVKYAYSANGWRTQAGGDSYVYDVRGRLVQDQKAAGQTISYTHDIAGNLTSVTTSQGTTTYSHDALNRLATVADGAGTTFYTYDAVGRLASVASPNGVTATYGYDTLNRLRQVTNTGPVGLISSYSYTLGPAGNRVQVVEAGSATDGRTVTYAFDAAYRLVGESIVQGGVPGVNLTYSYDPVGNRTQMNRGGAITIYTYDADDRLLMESGPAGPITSTYDANGNLISRTKAANADTYVYDGENRLVGASGPAGNVSYTYDGDGMRTSKTVGGVTTAYLLDKAVTAAFCRCRHADAGTLAQVLVETTGANVVTYTYGHALLDQTQTGIGTHIYLADGQLSTRQLTNGAGAVTDTYTYDAFGVQLSATGSTPNAYLYTGEQWDPNLGFYYLRARYYQTTTGRFTSTDPEDGNIFDPVSLHRYQYANANPVDNRDPSGRLSLPEISVVQGISVALGAGVAVGVGSRATGLTRDFSEAFLVGAATTAMVAAALVPGAYRFEETLARANGGTILKSTFNNFLHYVYGATLQATGLEAEFVLQRSAEAVLRSYIARTFVFSAAARCIFVRNFELLLAEAVTPELVIGATAIFTQEEQFIGKGQQTVVILAQSLEIVRSIGHALGCPG